MQLGCTLRRNEEESQRFLQLFYVNLVNRQSAPARLTTEAYYNDVAYFN